VFDIYFKSIRAKETEVVSEWETTNALISYKLESPN